MILGLQRVHITEKKGKEVKRGRVYFSGCLKTKIYSSSLLTRTCEWEIVKKKSLVTTYFPRVTFSQQAGTGHPYGVCEPATVCIHYTSVLCR